MNKVAISIPPTPISRPPCEETGNEIIIPPVELICEELCFEFAYVERESTEFLYSEQTQCNPSIVIKLLPDSNSLILFDVETGQLNYRTLYELPFKFTETQWVMLNGDTVLFTGAIEEETTLPSVCRYTISNATLDVC
jgi:hypothetical protein